MTKYEPRDLDTPTPPSLRAGTIRLPISVLAILVSTLIASIGGVITVSMTAATTTTQLIHLSEQVRVNQVMLFNHIAESGHPVSIERQNNILERVKKLEANPRP